jgi:hypothetical protein
MRLSLISNQKKNTVRVATFYGKTEKGLIVTFLFRACQTCFCVGEVWQRMPGSCHICYSTHETREGRGRTPF